LEKELSVRLFDCSKRKIALTEAESAVCPLLANEIIEFGNLRTYRLSPK